MLAFAWFDLVVRALRWSGRDWIIIPSEDTLPMEPESFCQIFEDANAGGFSPSNPVVQMSLGPDSVGLLPQDLLRGSGRSNFPPVPLSK